MTRLFSVQIQRGNEFFFSILRKKKRKKKDFELTRGISRGQRTFGSELSTCVTNWITFSLSTFPNFSFSFSLRRLCVATDVRDGKYFLFSLRWWWWWLMIEKYILFTLLFVTISSAKLDILFFSPSPPVTGRIPWIWKWRHFTRNSNGAITRLA